jgi:hypothetical protein
MGPPVWIWPRSTTRTVVRSRSCYRNRDPDAPRIERPEPRQGFALPGFCVENQCPICAVVPGLPWHHGIPTILERAAVLPTNAIQHNSRGPNRVPCMSHSHSFNNHRAAYEE